MRASILFGLAAAVALATGSADAQLNVDWSLLRPQPQPDFAGIAARAQQQGLAIRAQREANERAEADAQQAAADRAAVQQSSAERVDRAKRVGRLMATGDCDGAKSLALTEGDFDMAGRVPGLCVRKAQ